jgi:hypothetical protein
MEWLFSALVKVRADKKIFPSPDFPSSKKQFAKNFYFSIKRCAALTGANLFIGNPLLGQAT